MGSWSVTGSPSARFVVCVCVWRLKRRRAEPDAAWVVSFSSPSELFVARGECVSGVEWSGVGTWCFGGSIVDRLEGGVGVGARP